MKSREEIEAYLDLHHITLTHGRVNAICALCADCWSDGFEDCENVDVDIIDDLKVDECTLKCEKCDFCNKNDPDYTYFCVLGGFEIVCIESTQKGCPRRGL